MKTLKTAVTIVSSILILMIFYPATGFSEPIVMKFGLAAPDLNPSFWATHYNYFKSEVERKAVGSRRAPVG